ncbi:MAG: hypothetical protein WEA99_13905 [Brumimicrobium sp.]
MDSKTTLRWFIYLLVTFSSYIIGYFLLVQLGVLSEFPNNNNLLNWDSSWYHSIVNEGYYLDLENQCNAGFFPGFPYLWKLLGATPLMISIINGGLFISGLFILKEITQSDWKKYLIILSLPSTFFFFLPYSESLFYIFAILFIFGWVKGEVWMIIIFAILLSVVRPVFFFLIPALVVLNLFFQDKTVFKNSFLTIVSLLLGAFIGFVIIGLETGDLFAYSKSQVNQWGHEFKLTSLPLTTWRGYRILWLDALALFTAFIALFLLIKAFFFKKIKGKPHDLSQLEVIGLSYLVMILVYVLFFHPVEDGRTTILSINRYVFCNPFLHYILFKRLISIKLEASSLSLPVIVSVIILFIFGIPFYSIIGLDYNNSLVFGVAILIFALAQSLLIYKYKLLKYYFIPLVILNVLLQLYLLNSYLKGNWIG